MPVSAIMLEQIGQAAKAVQRWKTALVVPEDADDARAASLIRGAMVRAAREAAAFQDGPVYNDDHSWSHNGMRGITRARIRDEVEISRDRMAPSPEEWGIMARVQCGEVFFDVPIAMDLDEAAARNVLERMVGMEARFVDVESIARALPGEAIEVFFHADNWGRLREIALDGFLTMDEAMDYRRPVVWDLMRARLAELPVPALPSFSLEEFHTRYARSARYDAALMRSAREMVEPLARIVAEPRTPAWGEWLPAVIDAISAIGAAQPMDGISVILNFAVEEPVRDSPGQWAPVGYHNVVVAYGLEPLNAIHVLDFVRENPTAFYDLPPGEDRRHVLVGASAIQDTMLSMLRVSAYGRTDAYERMVDVGVVR